MFNKIYNTLKWIPGYYINKIGHLFENSGYIDKNDKHIFFCICDHYEPYWKNDSQKTAQKRISKWLDEYPKIAEKVLDSDGKHLKYSFFYPEEEYRFEDMKLLSKLCHDGFGEVEIHLHHDNDTSENLKRTLVEFKKRLHGEHGLLSINSLNNDISYGFIHGNWALDNSRPDGRKCGVNDEISILQETGCYADFTMPSAPSDTQTRKVNSIYYAKDDPQKPKSHDTGRDVVVGVNNTDDCLLMVQGPLGLNWGNRKLGIFPRIENGGLIANCPPTPERIELWINQHIHITGYPQGVFIKIYTHGTQENNMQMLFDHNYLEKMCLYFSEYADKEKCRIHFLSAREMVNVINAIIEGNTQYKISLRDFIFQMIY